MKLSSNVTMEFKSVSSTSLISFNKSTQRQMVAPGGSCCTIGCSCSCSCGATRKA